MTPGSTFARIEKHEQFSVLWSTNSVKVFNSKCSPQGQWPLSSTSIVTHVLQFNYNTLLL